jgi:hypothetical protein
MTTLLPTTCEVTNLTFPVRPVSSVVNVFDILDDLSCTIETPLTIGYVSGETFLEKNNERQEEFLEDILYTIIIYYI